MHNYTKLYWDCLKSFLQDKLHQHKAVLQVEENIMACLNDIQHTSLIS